MPATSIGCSIESVTLYRRHSWGVWALPFQLDLQWVSLHLLNVLRTWINSINKTLLGLFPVAPRVPGPISRYRIADILRHRKLVSRASRPELIAVSYASSVMRCALHRGFTEDHDYTCRIGFRDELDSLTRYNECPRLKTTFLYFWRDMLQYCHKEIILYMT